MNHSENKINMDTTTPQNRIKPLLTHAIHIKSPFTYKTYLLRNPKQTLTFKFTRQTRFSKDIIVNQARSERKLQTALSLLKSAKKVDLSQFQVSNEHLNHNCLQSCFKRVSKIPTLLFTRNQLDNQLKTNLAEKSFKHLPRLHNLAYELINHGADRYHVQCIKDDPLNHLKYHSKLKSLGIGTSNRGFEFSKVFSAAGLKKYLASLKHLTITSLLNVDFPLHFEQFLQLESIDLKLNDDGLLPKGLDSLSELPKLQSLSLYFKGVDIPTLSSMFLKLAERKVLKKIRLACFSFLHIDRETLKAIQKFDQLTHLDIQMHIADDDSDGTLKLAADCLENMKYLEDLKLGIQKMSYFKSFDALQIICEKISRLEFLKHLDLLFVPFMVFTKIPNFLLHLQSLFTKPTKLQTLMLHYVQLDSTQALLDLAKLLQNSSSSLQKLKIYFGYCSPDQQSQKVIIDFLKSLCNIQVLEFSGLQIEVPNFFGQIAEAISRLRYLREFQLGDIKDQVPLSECKNALETMITKRGLREFRCHLSETLLKKCGFERDRNWKLYSLQIDMKKVEMRNPYLESIYLCSAFFHFDLLKEFSELI